MFGLSRLQSRELVRRIRNEARTVTGFAARGLGAQENEPFLDGQSSRTAGSPSPSSSLPAPSHDDLTTDSSLMHGPSSQRNTEDGMDIFFGEATGQWLVLNIYDLSQVVYQRLLLILDYFRKNPTMAVAGASGAFGGLVIMFGGKSLAAFSWKDFLSVSTDKESHFAVEVATRVYAAYAFAAPIIRLRDLKWQREQRREIRSQQLQAARMHSEASLEQEGIYYDCMSHMLIEHPVVVVENGVSQLFDVRSLRGYFIYQTRTLGIPFTDVLNPLTGLPFQAPFHSLEGIVESELARKEMDAHKRKILQSHMGEIANSHRMQPTIPNYFMRRLETALVHFLIAFQGGPLVALGSSVLGLVSLQQPVLSAITINNEVTLQYS
jgi:hypothetical protein